MKQTYEKKNCWKLLLKYVCGNVLFSRRISFLKPVLKVTICFPTAIVLTGKMELEMSNIIKLLLKSSSFFPGNSGVVVILLLILLCFLSGWYHRALLQDSVCDAKSQKDLWQTHWELECQVIFISISLQRIYLFIGQVLDSIFVFMTSIWEWDFRRMCSRPGIFKLLCFCF